MTNDKKIIHDTVFKYLFKSQEYRSWFLEIIKLKTGIDLSEYKLIDNELNTGTIIKDYRLDLLLEKDDINVIIEINSGN